MHTYRVTVELLTKDKSRHVKKIVETQAEFDLENVWEIVRIVEARRKWGDRQSDGNEDRENCDCCDLPF